jgi:hypothetical protein
MRSTGLADTRCRDRRPQDAVVEHTGMYLLRVPACCTRQAATPCPYDKDKGKRGASTTRD